VRREPHARFCERPEGKLLRPTHHRLHWMLDVVFREDLTRLRSGNAPENMAVVRHVARNLLSRAKPITSFKNRRKKAGWDGDYLETVLHHTA
jgi:hypothetical protein